MNTPRAITIVYSGSEVTDDLLQSLRASILSHIECDVESIRIGTFDTSDIITLVTRPMVNATIEESHLKKKARSVKVHVRSNILEQYINFLVNRYGAGAKSNDIVPIIQMSVDYKYDNSIRTCFNEINKIDDDELFQNEAVIKHGISRSFIRCLRKIVKTLNYVSR